MNTSKTIEELIQIKDIVDGTLDISGNVNIFTESGEVLDVSTNIMAIASNPVDINTGLAGLGTIRVAVAEDSSLNITNIDLIVDVSGNVNLSGIGENKLETFLPVEITQLSSPNMESLLSELKIIYNSNYRGLQETDDQEYFETDGGSAFKTYSPQGGLIIDLMELDNYKRICRFFTYLGGRTLYVFNTSNPSFSANDQFLQFYGLEEKLGHQIRFKLSAQFSGISTIEIIIDSTSNLGIKITKTITQAEFNVDKIDGTGISQFTYEPHYQNTKLFILTDDNTFYIFGVLSNNRLIPIHHFIQNEITAATTNGSRFGHHRAYMDFEREDGNISVNLISNLGLTIYKDTLPSYNSSITIIDNFTVSSSNDPFMAIQFVDITKYRGNVQIRTFTSHCNKPFLIRIYLGRDSNLSITGGSFTQLRNIEYNTTMTSFSGGVLIYSFLIPEGFASTDLTEFLDWKLFSYDLNMTVSNVLLFTANELAAGQDSFDFTLNLSQF